MVVDKKQYSVEFSNPFYAEPPGCLSENLAHPSGRNETVELALFNDHRYAFYYWLTWTRDRGLNRPPDLVTLDWHQDLVYPCEETKGDLSRLDCSSDHDIALYSWARLGGNNDDHILSAAYLNAIGDIYVFCRQSSFIGAWEDEEIMDVHGNLHTIRKYRTIEDLEKALARQCENPKLYWDIDLDVFTITNHSLSSASHNFTYMKRSDIKNMLSIDRPLVKLIFDRMAGFTIALEPEHTGGLLKSFSFLQLINKTYFRPGLFSEDCKWKHLGR
jgi:hypothetical protein